MNCVLAVKLPDGACFTAVEPKPDGIRNDESPTLIWRESLSGLQEFAISVEYRLGEKG
jgi:hypothetical protein